VPTRERTSPAARAAPAAWVLRVRPDDIVARACDEPPDPGHARRADRRNARRSV